MYCQTSQRGSSLAGLNVQLPLWVCQGKSAAPVTVQICTMAVTVPACKHFSGFRTYCGWFSAESCAAAATRHVLLNVLYGIKHDNLSRASLAQQVELSIPFMFSHQSACMCTGPTHNTRKRQARPERNARNLLQPCLPLAERRPGPRTLAHLKLKLERVPVPHVDNTGLQHRNSVYVRVSRSSGNVSIPTCDATNYITSSTQP